MFIILLSALFFLSMGFLSSFLTSCFGGIKVQHLLVKCYNSTFITSFRSNRSRVSLRKGVLKICSKFTGEHPHRSVISIKLLCSFIEITLRYECSPLNLLHIFRTSFPKSTFARLVLPCLLIVISSEEALSLYKISKCIYRSIAFAVKNVSLFPILVLVFLITFFMLTSKSVSKIFS